MLTAGLSVLGCAGADDPSPGGTSAGGAAAGGVGNGAGGVGAGGVGAGTWATGGAIATGGLGGAGAASGAAGAGAASGAAGTGTGGDGGGPTGGGTGGTGGGSGQCAVAAAGSTAPPGAATDPKLTAVSAVGGQLTFTVCGTDKKSELKCGPSSISLQKFTASGSISPPAGFHLDPLLTSVVGNGNTIDFTVCGRNQKKYESKCHVQSIALSGAEASGTAAPPSGYTLQPKVTAATGSAGKLIFTACGTNSKGNPNCNKAAAIDLKCPN